MTNDSALEAQHDDRRPRLAAICRALRRPLRRVGRVARQLRTWVAARHESGTHSLFCLDAAHHFYGEPRHGLGYRVWQVRNYWSGFFHP